MNVAPLNRTLDQELIAFVRGASLECLVCGEFVMHLADGSRFCPECGTSLRVPAAGALESEGGAAEPLFR